MLQAQQARKFGMDDDLTCPFCGQRMLVSRRSSQPDYPADYETQSFTCVSCDHELTRTVDGAGEPRK
jgi:transposase-like protein